MQLVAFRADSGTGDTTPPTVAITAPTGGSVSGSVTVTANASDNVAVASVQFLLDGNALGAADTTSPYSTTWDTTTATNTAHTLTARATDTSGNTTTSAPINITVSNTQGTASPAFVQARANEVGEWYDERSVVQQCEYCGELDRGLCDLEQPGWRLVGG